MSIPEDLMYTREHEWVLIEDDIATFGITDFAQSELGDVVFVELPETETEVEQNEPAGTIEAVKTVADLFAPLSGAVVEVNEALADDPDTVNRDPYGDGWMVKLRFSNETELEDLLSPDEYKEIVDASEDDVIEDDVVLEEEENE
ncbi:MAG: glycine cleavage system protein GcvH [Gemmatimonadetes bacterium]|nr:glycine cleavage system protein GcvH [Gemmatimonadota bacterium]